MVSVAQIRRGLMILRRLLTDRTVYKLAVLEDIDGKTEKTCPICNYAGPFPAFGNPPRFNALCGRCRSLERHRLLVLADRERKTILEGKKVLHFAPERIIRDYVRNITTDYICADISGIDVDRKENIEDLSFGSELFDLIICNHVLEHVDDTRALRELHRVLKPGGLLITMVPIVEGWERTYENPRIVDLRERIDHFGTSEHVRYYGRDFRDRLTAAGFTIEEYTAQGEAVVLYALTRGEKVFFCYRS